MVQRNLICTASRLTRDVAWSEAEKNEAPPKDAASLFHLLRVLPFLLAESGIIVLLLICASESTGRDAAPRLSGKPRRDWAPPSRPPWQQIPLSRFISTKGAPARRPWRRVRRSGGAVAIIQRAAGSRAPFNKIVPQGLPRRWEIRSFLSEPAHRDPAIEEVRGFVSLILVCAVEKIRVLTDRPGELVWVVPIADHGCVI